MLKAWSQHWPEYLAEAAGLGLFMISACVFVAMLEYEASWLRHGIEDPVVRRLLIGIAMGLTAIAIIYSPWGKRSGAHLNPAVTLTFSDSVKLSHGTPYSMCLPNSQGG
jgi:aquaporin Z